MYMYMYRHINTADNVNIVRVQYRHAHPHPYPPLSLNQSINLSIYLLGCPSIYTSIDLAFCRSIYLFVRLSIYPSTCTYISIYAHTHIQIQACVRACIIYVYTYMVTPPTTRTPLKNTVNTDTNAVLFRIQFWSCFYRLETQV